MKPISKLYILAIATAAVVAAVAMPREGVLESLPALSALIVLAALAGSYPVRIPRSKVEFTAGDVFTFCALPTVGPLGAVLVALAGALGATVAAKRRAAAPKVIFNLGTLTLSAAAAGAVWTFSPLVASSGPAAGALSLLAASLGFLLVNALSLAMMLKLQENQPFFAFLGRAIAITTASTLASTLAAVGLAAFIEFTGPIALALGLFVSAELVRAYKARGFTLTEASR